MLLPESPPVVVEYDGTCRHQDAFQRDQDKAADLTASGHLVICARVAVRCVSELAVPS